MSGLKNSASGVLNSKYNKGVYTAAVGAGVTLALMLINKFAGISFTLEEQGIIMTFAMTVTTLFVGNKS